MVVKMAPMMVMAMLVVARIAILMDVTMCRDLGVDFRSVSRELMIMVMAMIMTMSVMSVPKCKDADQIDKKP